MVTVNKTCFSFPLLKKSQKYYSRFSRYRQKSKEKFHRGHPLHRIFLSLVTLCFSQNHDLNHPKGSKFRWEKFHNSIEKKVFWIRRCCRLNNPMFSIDNFQNHRKRKTSVLIFVSHLFIEKKTNLSVSSTVKFFTSSDFL
jgi:hypothetical protein